MITGGSHLCHRATGLAPPGTTPLASTVPSPISTVSPTPAPAQLLNDRGFHALEPLDEPDEDIPTIILDDGKTFQTIVGFGGAFTDAAATVSPSCRTIPRRNFSKLLRSRGWQRLYPLPHHDP